MTGNRISIRPKSFCSLRWLSSFKTPMIDCVTWHTCISDTNLLPRNCNILYYSFIPSFIDKDLSVSLLITGSWIALLIVPFTSPRHLLQLVILISPAKRFPKFSSRCGSKWYSQANGLLNWIPDSTGMITTVNLLAEVQSRKEQSTPFSCR